MHLFVELVGWYCPTKMKQTLHTDSPLKASCAAELVVALFSPHHMCHSLYQKVNLRTIKTSQRSIHIATRTHT